MMIFTDSGPVRVNRRTLYGKALAGFVSKARFTGAATVRHGMILAGWLRDHHPSLSAYDSGRLAAVFINERPDNRLLAQWMGAI